SGGLTSGGLTTGGFTSGLGLGFCALAGIAAARSVPIPNTRVKQWRSMTARVTGRDSFGGRCHLYIAPVVSIFLPSTETQGGSLGSPSDTLLQLHVGHFTDRERLLV